MRPVRAGRAPTRPALPRRPRGRGRPGRGAYEQCRHGDLHRPGVDPALEAAVTTDAERDAELEAALSDLRAVKDEWERGELRKAVDSTVRGFTDVVGELSRVIASSERWIEGTFFRRARLEGDSVGYGSICAAGEHATITRSPSWTRPASVG